MNARKLVVALVAASLGSLPLVGITEYGRPGQPPAAATAACSGHAEGDSVSFQTPRGNTVTGICRAMNGALVAMPSQRQGGQQGMSGARGQGGGPPAEAYTACQEKQEGDTVQFANRRGGTVTGTCRTLDGKLVAMPDRHPPVGSGGPAVQ